MKNYPEGKPVYYTKARDRRGYYVRFVDRDGTDRAYYVEDMEEAKRIIDQTETAI